MPTAKELGIKVKTRKEPLDLTGTSMEELDVLWMGSDTNSPPRIQIANEIDRRVIKELKGKKKKKGKLSKSELFDILEKGKEMPIGTISHGRKKMPDGSWQPVSEGKSGKGKYEDKPVEAKQAKIRDFEKKITALEKKENKEQWENDVLKKWKETLGKDKKELEGMKQKKSEGKSGKGSSESVEDSTLKTIAYSERPVAEEKRQELELSMIKKDSRYDAKRYKDLMYGDDDAYEPTYQAMTKDVNKKIDALVKEYKKSNKSN